MQILSKFQAIATWPAMDETLTEGRWHHLMHRPWFEPENLMKTGVDVGNMCNSNWSEGIMKNTSWTPRVLIKYCTDSVDLRLDELLSVQIGKGPRESKMHVKENGSVDKREIDTEESQKENQSIMG